MTLIPIGGHLYFGRMLWHGLRQLVIWLVRGSSAMFLTIGVGYCRMYGVGPTGPWSDLIGTPWPTDPETVTLDDEIAREAALGVQQIEEYLTRLPGPAT